MNELIKNYQKNCTGWNNLHAESEEVSREYDKKIWDVKDSYRDRISEIERKMYSEIQVLEKEKDTRINELKEKKDAAAIKIKQAQELFSFVHLHVKGWKVITPDIYYYDNRNHMSYKSFLTIREDKYCRVYMYIVSNRKPVNKFSLIVAGSCPVLEPHRDHGNPLYSYGVDAHAEERVQIMFNVKDDYSDKYLQDYAKNNMKKILQKLSLIDANIAKYEEAVETFKSTEGKIAYYEWRKYYYENHYSHGTKTPEYKAVLKKLKQLKG